MALNGLLLVDKAADWTSHDVVAKLRSLLKTKKAGHAGTLDPQATGLVVVALGQATRWLDCLPSDKSYRASLQLGLETNTQDIWGEVIAEKDCAAVSAEQLKNAVMEMQKVTWQVPPMVSALKKDGKKLYELARQGKEVKRSPRPVSIRDLKVLKVEPPLAEFELSCGAGTYVRTLCHDLGQKLGTGACMSSLRRTASGSFKIEEALTLQQIEALGVEGIARHLVAADRALAHLPECRLTDEQRVMVDNGRSIEVPRIEDGPGQRWRLTRPDGQLAALAIMHRKGDQVELKPSKVFHEA